MPHPFHGKVSVDAIIGEDVDKGLLLLLEHNDYPVGVGLSVALSLQKQRYQVSE
jgi:hypothetical protein